MGFHHFDDGEIGEREESKVEQGVGLKRKDGKKEGDKKERGKGKHTKRKRLVNKIKEKERQWKQDKDGTIMKEQEPGN